MDSSSRVTFLGCALSGDTARQAMRWQGQLAAACAEAGQGRAVRWLSRSTLHLTLHYFGATRPADRERIQSAVAEVMGTREAISIRLRPPTPFPTPARIRGLLIEVQDAEGHLHRLHQELAAALRSLRLETRDARFRPHVTVGRIPRRVSRSQRQAVAAIAASPDMQGEAIDGWIDAVHHYQSVQRPGGNVYPPLASWPLSSP